MIADHQHLRPDLHQGHATLHGAGDDRREALRPHGRPLVCL